MGKTDYIAALDAGSGSATLAIGSMGPDGKLVITDITSRPMHGVTRGEITNRQQLSETVKELVAEVEGRLGLRISDLYTSTSGRHVVSTGHDYFVFVGERSDGEIRPEDVAALVEGMNNVQAEEGQRILDRVPQSYVVDGRDTVRDPVGRFGRKLDATFCFVLGSSTMIDRLEKTLLALGVRSRRSFAAGVASAEAVILPEEKEMGVAVVDLGAGTTDVCIWHDNAMRMVRGIPFGSDDINSDIHQQGILEKHVEGLKTTFGMAMADQVEHDKLIAITGRSPREKQEISQKNLAIIIENRLREIAGFVVEEIADAGYAGRLRGGIVLTGGGSALAGIDEVFRAETGLDVRLAMPTVRVADESVDLAENPSHATVIGLLLKALDEGMPASGVRTNDVRSDVQPRREAVAVHDTVGQTPRVGGRVATVAVEPSAEEDEPTEKPKKVKKAGRLRSWFDRFLDEPLEGDEDF